LIPCGVNGIFHWHNRPHYYPGFDQPITELSTRNFYWRVKKAGQRADNLTTFTCQFSWNLGTLTSWNPEGLSRLVQWLLYLYLLYVKMQMVKLGHKCFYKTENPSLFRSRSWLRRRWSLISSINFAFFKNQKPHNRLVKLLPLESVLSHLTP